MDVAMALVVVVVGAALFYLGSMYGRTAEQYIVARALAQYRQRYLAASQEITKILAGLKADYTIAYNEVVDEYDVIKKAL